MATISKSGISTNSTIQAEHITRVIDALDGTTSNDILVDNISIGDTNITGSTQTTLVFQNSISQSLSGVIYSKTDQVEFASEEPDVNLLSGSTSTVFGSANLPTSFFSSSPNYKSKILSFSVKGQLNSSNTDLVTYVGIDNGVTVTKLFENTVGIGNTSGDVPMEILGEIFINDRMAYPCISVRHCKSSNETYYAHPLSNLFTGVDISSLEGGEFGFYVSSSTTLDNITGSIGHIEIKN